jgi:hypothetical protein
MGNQRNKKKSTENKQKVAAKRHAKVVARLKATELIK